ncbi:MAG: hypothetical protein ACXAB2_07185 [Candidatus Hodarchaeales archaeon]|jgi:hypothetical protein
MEDTKIKLSALWVSHFLMWSFGDILSLLQTDGIAEISAEPVADEILLFIAAPLATIQVFMILFSLMGEYKWNRLANIGLPVIYLLFNFLFIADTILSQMISWAYLNGAVYIVINILVIMTAWKWTPE